MPLSLDPYTCLTCRHLKVMGQGMEFQGILDTEFIHFKCEIRGWETKEFFLMVAPHHSPSRAQERCPFWEQATRPLR